VAIKNINRSSSPRNSFEIFSSASLKPQSSSLIHFFRHKVHPRPVTKDEYQLIYDELKDINPDETIIWMGRSSQLIHLGAYVICLLFCLLFFPLLIAYYLYLQTKHTIYVLTNERLRVYSGIFIKRIDDVELYRVKDTIFLQPFLLGKFGFSNIQLITSDSPGGESQIQGITNGRLLREKIKNVVEAAREKKESGK